MGHLIYLAETEGFEPSIPFRGIHTFQACSFNHSDKSPLGAAKIRKIRGLPVARLVFVHPLKVRFGELMRGPLWIVRNKPGDP